MEKEIDRAALVRRYLELRSEERQAKYCAAIPNGYPAWSAAHRWVNAVKAPHMRDARRAAKEAGRIRDILGPVKWWKPRAVSAAFMARIRRQYPTETTPVWVARFLEPWERAKLRWIRRHGVWI